MNTNVTVQSISRAFTLLRTIAQYPQGITVTDLARQTKLHKSTVSRLILTLEAERAVARQNGTLYIGEGITKLVTTALSTATLVALVHPYLRTLVDQINETAGLCIPEETCAFYVDQITTDHDIQIRDWTGERYPLHAVSSGKLFLAYAAEPQINTYLAQPLAALGPKTITAPSALRQQLAQIRTQGYDWSLEEFTAGLAVVSAPIFDAHGTVIASIYVCGPTLRFPPVDKKETITQRVIAACQAITRTISTGQRHFQS
ncbi:MAG: IclR family transcriptional regulator [Caldilineaceae bacterium]|nr:IclR family transcriptional regulator [Caldilineaceae bacterium]